MSIIRYFLNLLPIKNKRIVSCDSVSSQVGLGEYIKEGRVYRFYNVVDVFARNYSIKIGAPAISLSCDHAAPIAKQVVKMPKRFAIFIYNVVNKARTALHVSATPPLPPFRAILQRCNESVRSCVSVLSCPRAYIEQVVDINQIKEFIS